MYALYSLAGPTRRIVIRHPGRREDLSLTLSSTRHVEIIARCTSRQLEVEQEEDAMLVYIA